MKREYDFSKAVRGKFYRKGAELRLLSEMFGGNLIDCRTSVQLGDRFLRADSRQPRGTRDGMAALHVVGQPRQNEDMIAKRLEWWAAIRARETGTGET